LGSYISSQNIKPNILVLAYQQVKLRSRTGVGECVEISGEHFMMKRLLIPLPLGAILVLAFLVAPVAGGGLSISEADVVTTPNGTASAVITITESNIAPEGTIFIDISFLGGLFASSTVTNANIVITSNATTAIWTGVVEGDYLTLTSTGGQTLVGEAINVTFKGTTGNPWIAYTEIPQEASLTATRDGYDPEYFSIWIDMALPVPTGLSIADGEPIITTNGATSPVITITDFPIARDGNITIFVPFLSPIIASNNLRDSNVIINDTAVAANWTRTVTGNRVILTSTEGPTGINETVTVIFTGVANPWIVSIPVGPPYQYITATRGDDRGAGYFNFTISTQDPTDLITEEGAKITATDGFTSPVITLTGSDIVQEGTIIIDVSGLNAYVANKTLIDDNVVVHDTAANATWTGAVADNILTLTSTGGPTVAGENITVSFTGAVNPWSANTQGEQKESLVATRTDGAGSGTFNFVIETTPPPGLMVAANFSASPTSDMAPLTVRFNDTSLGSPTSWIWDFGDGNFSTLRDPIYTYYSAGKYTVSLNATNAYGSDTRTRYDYIKVLTGTIREANTTITGLTVTNCGGPQTITVDTSVLPASLIPNNSVLEIQPPADRGLKNITIYALDGVGFLQNDSLISGNPTGVHLETEEISPSSGFSDEIGTGASFNYSIDLSSYPCNAILNTKLWDGVITEYDSKLWQVASNNSAIPLGTAYSANITKINFPNGTNAKIHMSVNSSWNPSFMDGESMVFIWRIADDGNSGQILPTTYLYTDPVNNLDYYEADSPLGLSTFGISVLTGNNNPFQIIALIAIQIIHPPNNPAPAALSEGGGGSSRPQTTVASGTTSPDQNHTVKIYSNDKGTITQATILRSNDGIARIYLDPGIVARNSSGMPLASLSIRQISAHELPAAPPDTSLSFTGMAYEIGPDGTTFSPPIPLSFTIPQDLKDQVIVLQEYNHSTGTWQALEGSYHPETGTLTAQVSHLCCFALFAQSTEIENIVTPEPTILIASKSSVSTDVEMYSWFISLLWKNPVIIVILLTALAAVAYFGWWKRRL
jgi:PKD repeat protein